MNRSKLDKNRDVTRTTEVISSGYLRKKGDFKKTLPEICI